MSTNPIKIEEIRSEINSTLQANIDSFCDQLIEIDPQMHLAANSLKGFLSDGKRFRPIFATIGFLGTGGNLRPEIYQAVVALEFLQACALIHDDLMDASDTRRGRPSIHKEFAQLKNEEFGNAAAILLGDLALIWNEQALQQSGISSASQLAVNPIHEIMRTELIAGQFLDILEQTEKTFSIERSLKIARFKSGKYSIERPLHFGAALNLTNSQSDLDNYLDIYSEYGLPLGEAFQLRDDLLGVFGDPKETGKPAGDDLSEGKHTALIAYAYERGGDSTKKLLESKLGQDLTENEIEQLRTAIIDSGAVTHIEDLIEKLAESALDAISRDELSEISKPLLSEMVCLVTDRKR